MALLESGRLTRAVGPRALDVGCGTGADCRLLAGHGFGVVGVDLPQAALGPARAPGGAPRYVQADPFALPPEVTGEPFDRILDGGTIDTLPPAGQRLRHPATRPIPPRPPDRTIARTEPHPGRIASRPEPGYLPHTTVSLCAYPYRPGQVEGTHHVR